VTRRTFAVDAVVAILLAALWLIIASGLAIVGIGALLAVLVCAISLSTDAWRRRARTRVRRGR
jgi:hypothetical protein